MLACLDSGLDLGISNMKIQPWVSLFFFLGSFSLTYILCYVR